MNPPSAKPVTPITVSRVLDKLDEYLNHNDYAAAERHLQYWLTEAEAGNDARGRLTILNEQIGLYRKTAQESPCLQAIESALAAAEALDMGHSVTMGTTLVNAATGYKAFDRPDLAISLYERAQKIYTEVLPPEDSRLGALYNNMALTVMALGDFDRAEALFHQALQIMEKQPCGEAEMAITYINLADLSAAKPAFDGQDEEINTCMDTAERLLNSKTLPRNGYYAFVCEKCAPAFGYYGYFMTEQELTRRAKEIYERT